jgi:hypothetical protein
MSVTIQGAVLNYKTVITTALEKMKEIHSRYVCKNPDWLRDNYDGTRQVLEAKTNEINEKKVYINECINNLVKCKESLSEMEEVIKEINIASNEGRVGTLQGLCLQTIKQNNIPMDEIEENVFSFPYNEKNEIENFKKSIQNIGVNEVVNNVGGKNNTKRKNYIAKNVNNKKSKKRRFK